MGRVRASVHHLDIVKRIVAEIGLPVQFGGGLRTMEAVKTVLDAGVARAVLGTAAVRDRQFREMALLRFGDKIAVSIDARGGKVAAQGWQETTEVDAFEYAQKVVDCGAARLVVTEISRDGMRSGPDLVGLRQLRALVEVPIVASGGVSSAADLIALRDIGMEAAIAGRAIYTGDVDLRQFPGAEV